jgi:hypothetical protein
VYARVLDRITLPRFAGEIKDDERLEAVVLASLTDCRISTAAIPLTAAWMFGDQRLMVPLEYSEARNLAGKVRLRTLDLLHVAYASVLLKTGTPITRIVTGDEELLAREGPIHGATKIRVVRPSANEG